jgi:hypothetical protein
VIERDVRRRAQHDEDARRVDAQAVEHRRIRREIRQVVLLLEPGILDQLRRLDPVAAQPLGRDRLRHHHAPGEAAADVVLLGRPFVVERVHGRDAQHRGGEREVVGAVTEREVEAAPAEADHAARA